MARSKERSDLLMRELDRDIAAMLEEDFGTPDHNADKKLTLDDPLHSTSESLEAPILLSRPASGSRREIRAVSVDSADSIRESSLLLPGQLPNSISTSEMNVNTELDKLSQLGSPSLFSSKSSPGGQESLNPNLLGTASTEGASAKSEDSEKCNLGMSESPHCLPSYPLQSAHEEKQAVPSLEEFTKEKEMHTLQLAALQVMHQFIFF